MSNIFLKVNNFKKPKAIINPSNLFIEIEYFNNSGASKKIVSQMKSNFSGFNLVFDGNDVALNKVFSARVFYNGNIPPHYSFVGFVNFNEINLIFNMFINGGRVDDSYGLATFKSEFLVKKSIKGIYNISTVPEDLNVVFQIKNEKNVIVESKDFDITALSSNRFFNSSVEYIDDGVFKIYKYIILSAVGKVSGENYVVEPIEFAFDINNSLNNYKDVNIDFIKAPDKILNFKNDSSKEISYYYEILKDGEVVYKSVNITTAPGSTSKSKATSSKYIIPGEYDVRVVFNNDFNGLSFVSDKDYSASITPYSKSFVGFSNIDDYVVLSEVSKLPEIGDDDIVLALEDYQLFLIAINKKKRG